MLLNVQNYTKVVALTVLPVWIRSHGTVSPTEKKDARASAEFPRGYRNLAQAVRLRDLMPDFTPRHRHLKYGRTKLPASHCTPKYICTSPIAGETPRYPLFVQR